MKNNVITKTELMSKLSESKEIVPFFTFVVDKLETPTISEYLELLILDEHLIKVTIFSVNNTQILTFDKQQNSNFLGSELESFLQKELLDSHSSIFEVEEYAFEFSDFSKICMSFDQFKKNHDIFSKKKNDVIPLFTINSEEWDGRRSTNNLAIKYFVEHGIPFLCYMEQLYFCLNGKDWNTVHQTPKYENNETKHQFFGKKIPKFA